MKKLLAIALFAASLALPAQAVFVGASVGYLTDSKDTYFAGRIGTEFSSNATLSHNGEFEIGYTSDSEGGAKASILPLTANYRAQFAGNDKFGGYVGLGAGLARTKISGFGLSDNDWSLALQGFAGVSLKISPTASLDLGARYIWVNDVKLLGVNLDVGDDLALEVGFHVKF